MKMSLVRNFDWSQAISGFELGVAAVTVLEQTAEINACC
jgi:hypothetical protein